MAANFKIQKENQTQGLCLKLTGDFDGTSALELVDVLSVCSKMADKIFLDTGGLQEVWGFGQAVFEDACSDLREIRGGTTKLIVTGDKLSL